MTTSAENFQLSKPAGEARVAPPVLSYFEGRNRYKVYDLVMDEFMASGLTKATLARRLGKRPEQINRLLKSPGNWTLDTVSNLLFAIRGGEPRYGVRFPLDEPARNDNQPHWINEQPAKETASDNTNATAKIANRDENKPVSIVSRST